MLSGVERVAYISPIIQDTWKGLSVYCRRGQCYYTYQWNHFSLKISYCPVLPSQFPIVKSPSLKGMQTSHSSHSSPGACRVNHLAISMPYHPLWERYYEFIVRIYRLFNSSHHVNIGVSRLWYIIDKALPKKTAA